MPNKEKLPTEIAPIDELLRGGFPVGNVSGIFSFPNLGKSTLCDQLILSCNKNLKRPALLIETEGKEEHHLVWLGYLEKRFGIKADYNLIPCRGLKNLLNLFGFDLDIEISKKGRFDVKIRPADLMIEKVLKEKNYGLLIIDSFSNPIKTTLPIATENLPARSTIENLFFGSLQVLSEAKNLAVILTHHVSVNPQQPFDIGEPWGGPILLYNTGYLVQILPPDKTLYSEVGEEGRRIIRYRWAGLPKSDKVPVRLKRDFGYTEV